LKGGVKMKEYYFTFGTSEQFPFKKGFVVVIADNKNRAVEIFNAHYPPVHKDIINCAFVYDEEAFKETNMFKEYSDWNICHRVLEQ